MSLWTLQHPRDLQGFLSSSCSAALWQRTPPPGSDTWFDPALTNFSGYRQQVTPDQVDSALEGLFSPQFWSHPLGSVWKTDVAELCRAFCQELAGESCLLQFDCERPCQRFHADNLLMRLVCSYRGPGTQWLEGDNLNQAAAETRGTSNQDIVLRPQDIRQLGPWEVLVMKGKRASQGAPLYHKSPTPQADDPKSLVLKLDAVS